MNKSLRIRQSASWVFLPLFQNPYYLSIDGSILNASGSEAQSQNKGKTSAEEKDAILSERFNG